MWLYSLMYGSVAVLRIWRHFAGISSIRRDAWRCTARLPFAQAFHSGHGCGATYLYTVPLPPPSPAYSPYHLPVSVQACSFLLSAKRMDAVYPFPRTCRRTGRLRLQHWRGAFDAVYPGGTTTRPADAASPSFVPYLRWGTWDRWRNRYLFRNALDDSSLIRQTICIAWCCHLLWGGWASVGSLPSHDSILPNTTFSSQEASPAGACVGLRVRSGGSLAFFTLAISPYCLFSQLCSSNMLRCSKVRAFMHICGRTAMTFCARGATARDRNQRHALTLVSG